MDLSILISCEDGVEQKALLHKKEEQMTADVVDTHSRWDLTDLQG
jgi:hypothetical protein